MRKLSQNGLNVRLHTCMLNSAKCTLLVHLGVAMYALGIHLLVYCGFNTVIMVWWAKFRYLP